MGNTFTIKVWTRSTPTSPYGYEEFWAGEDALEALQEMLKARAQGYGCIAFEWRK